MSIIKNKITIMQIIKWRYPIIISFFIIMISLQLHGISIPVWNNYFQNDAQAWSIGNLRPITSDVWGIVIPQTMSQAANGYPLMNPDLMNNGMNALLAHLPALNISIVVGQPVFWGYYLFGVDAGVSWFYWFRILGILLSGYEIIFFLTEKEKISLVGALLIAFAPATLWWGGHILPEILLYAQMVIAGGICYIKNWNNWKIKILCALIVISGSVGFVITLYPALQVPLGIMVLIFAISIIVEQRKTLRLKKFDIALFCISAAVVAILIIRIFIQSAESIQSMLVTSFPGKRFTRGAGGTLLHIFYSMFQGVLPFRDAVGTNNCEASSFLPVWPAVLTGIPILCSRLVKFKHSVLIKSIYIYFLFCISWLVFAFPSWFAYGTLFYNVTNNRLMWTIGIMSIYLVCVIMSRKMSVTKGYRRYSAVITGLIVALFLISIQRGNEYVNFLIPKPWLFTFCGLLFVGLLSLSILLCNKKGFIVISAIFILICVLFINPISQGVSAITDKRISEVVKTIEAANPNSYWVYAESYPYGNYLSANGVRSFNATNYYMDQSKWNIIDPTGDFVESYNRYCQVGVTLGYQTKFDLVSPDNLNVTLTANNLLDLGIDFVVSNQNLDSFSQDNGDLLTIVQKVNEVCIYKVNHTIERDNLPIIMYDVIESKPLTPSPPLMEHTRYLQEFTATGNYLTSIDVLFGTYGRINRSLLQIELWDSEKAIYSEVVTLDGLKDNDITSFYMGQIPLIKDKQYTIIFTPVCATQEDFITIYQDEASNLALRIKGM